ncbi:unnamed protein product [Staurois parvus]|uniref:Uncharacterized protein n=1 Tax=Staurois parvus TaxID=386267 RepID=A0ABN9BEI5_9NEOB|nr:unnamed protein product [Staurois parvus]
MDAQHSALPVTIHLLVSKGDFAIFHQAIDRLLQSLYVDTPLFIGFRTRCSSTKI